MEKDRKDRNVIRQLRQVYKAKKLDNRKIILFGCTPGAKILRDELKKYGFQLSAIIDNNKGLAGQKCLDVTIYTPKDYLGNFQDDVAVLIWSGYWREMLKQLEDMGYQRDVHLFVFWSILPKIKNDSIKTFCTHAIGVVKGIYIYQNYQKKYGKNVKIFICPYPGTGDVYMAGGFFQYYIKRENIEHYTVLVMNRACSKTASLFQMENVEIVSEKEKNNLMFSYDFLGPEELNMKPLLYWGWRTKRSMIQRHCGNMNFNDMFQYDVYGLEPEVRRDFPTFKNDSQYIETFFKEHHLVKGKTVILVPYAGSFVSDIPKTFWKRLADVLKKRGYRVCTNSSGEAEPVIEGTETVFFELTQTVPILEAAGYFVALRSGLCDIGSSAKCRKIILYENGFNASQYSFFSLKRMGLSDDAIELIYKCESDTEFLNIVLKYFEE